MKQLMMIGFALLQISVYFTLLRQLYSDSSGVIHIIAFLLMCLTLLRYFTFKLTSLSHCENEHTNR
jgi:hypothetical protein